jgi:hypothetical protein
MDNIIDFPTVTSNVKGRSMTNLHPSEEVDGVNCN